MAILSSDPQAKQKLEEKIKRLEAERTRNNAINKLVRKNDVEGMKEMGLSEQEIEKLMKPNWSGRVVGIPSYVNQNISGNIRTAKQRIAQIEQRDVILKDEPSEMDLGELQVEFNVEDDRLRIFFDDIPDADVRKALKGNGFRWSPKNMAWQRQITANAKRSLKWFLKDHFPEAYKAYELEMAGETETEKPEIVEVAEKSPNVQIVSLPKATEKSKYIGTDIGNGRIIKEVKAEFAKDSGWSTRIKYEDDKPDHLSRTNIFGFKYYPSESEALTTGVEDMLKVLKDIQSKSTTVKADPPKSQKYNEGDVVELDGKTLIVKSLEGWNDYDKEFKIAVGEKDSIIDEIVSEDAVKPAAKKPEKITEFKMYDRVVNVGLPGFSGDNKLLDKIGTVDLVKDGVVFVNFDEGGMLGINPKALIPATKEEIIAAGDLYRVKPEFQSSEDKDQLFNIVDADGTQQIIRNIETGETHATQSHAIERWPAEYSEPIKADETATEEIDHWNDGNEFFEKHEEKVLGVPYEASGLRGKVILHKGDISDLEKIDIPTDWLESQDPESVTVSQVHSEIKNIEKPETKIIQLTTNQEENIDKAIAKSKSDIVKKARKKSEPVVSESGAEIISFMDILKSKEYNGKISEEELKVFIWHKWDIGQALGGEWLNVYDPELEFTEEQLKEWIIAGHVCYLDGELLPSYKYFSGNIYERQDQLMSDKPKIIALYGEEVFKAQELRLGDLYQELINNRLRLLEDYNSPVRLSIKPIAEFSYNYRIATLNDMKPFKVRASGRQDDLGRPDFLKNDVSDSRKTEYSDLNLVDAFVYWLSHNSGTIAFKKGITWEDIYLIYIKSGRRPQKTDPTVWLRTKANAKAEGDRLFNEFLATIISESDREAIELHWNKQYNSYKEVDYDKIPIAFPVAAYYPGNDPMEIRKEKRDAIAFAFNEGTALFAYGVGVGKTWAATYAIGQSLAAEYCKRPLLVVPNQTYKQWISEISGILPYVKINDLYNLSEEYIKKLQDENGNTLMVAENSISIMTYEGFANLGLNDSTRSELIGQFSDILSQETGKDKTERQRASFGERLSELVGKGIEGTMVDIEDLGFDYACWDEAHAMKKVFTSVKSAAKGDSQKKTKDYEISSGTPSATALRGFMISQYIARNNNERNVLMLTATPFTNSPLEVYSMLAIVGYEKLVKAGLNNLTTFFDTYVQVEMELVINAALKPVRKQIFKGFDNLQALQKLIFRFVDYKEALNLKRPNKYVLPYKGRMVDGTYVPASDEETVNTVIPMDAQQELWMQDVRAFAEGKINLEAICLYDQPEEGDDEDGIEAATPYSAINPELLTQDERRGQQVLMAVGMAKNLMLSPYLYQCGGLPKPTAKEYVESSPKLRYAIGCIKTVKQYHENEGTPMSGQVIYMDLGVDLFPLVAEYIVENLGFKKHEVGIISAKMKAPKGVSRKDAKEAVQNLFLGRKFNDETRQFEPIPDDQRIKVLIGSPSIREGINLQRHSSVLYNLTLPWNPTDVVQLEGRIWRQGNLFESVRIVNPLLENSMDAFIFQKLEEKTSRINALFNRDGKTNFLSTEEFSPQELKKELIRDPRALAEMIADEDKEKVQDEKGAFENNIKIANDLIEKIKFIERNKSYTIDAVENVRPIAEGQTRSLNTYLNLTAKIIKEQTNSKGEPLESNFYVPWKFVEVRAAVRDLERQKRVFLDPRNIPLDENALSAYIQDETEKLNEIQSRVDEISSEENIDRLEREIIQKRIETKFEPASVPERVAEFSKLNHLLSEKRVVEKKAEAPKPDMANAKAKAMARARARIRILELQAKAEKPKKSSKPKFEDLPTSLSNKYMTADINMMHKNIGGSDKTDMANMPMFYSTTWRSHKKAWTALVEAFNDDMRMYDAMGVLSKNGVKTKSYLSMD